MAGPFLKWAGGKQRLVPRLKKLLPKDFAQLRYIEPFVGGGAMFFALEPAEAILGDANAELIDTYEAVRCEVEAVISALRKLEKRHGKRHYYLTRERFNRSEIEQPLHVRAARFIYLNKTCFNGLWRVNAAGCFNVPMGSYRRPQIVNEAALRAASAVLQRAQFASRHADVLIDDCGAGDFIYADPPYDPISRTASFTGYAQAGFNRAAQMDLRDALRRFHHRGGKFMLSNSNTTFIRDLYKAFSVRTIKAPRSISAKGAGRGSVREFVICNY